MQVDTEVFLDIVLYVGIDNLHTIHTWVGGPSRSNRMINGATTSQTDEVLARGMLHKERICLLVKRHQVRGNTCVRLQGQRQFANALAVVV